MTSLFLVEIASLRGLLIIKWNKKEKTTSVDKYIDDRNITGITSEHPHAYQPRLFFLIDLNRYSFPPGGVSSLVPLWFPWWF